MKGILKFNLDNRDDDMALKRCHKSLAMAMVLWQLKFNGRKIMEGKTSEEIFDYIDDLLDEHSIIIDELTE